MTGLTERIAGQHMVDGGKGLGFALGKNDALASSQTVCLDDNRCSLLAHVGFGCGNVSEVLVGGGGNTVPGQKVLTERLGTLKLGCALGWAKYGQSSSNKLVNHTGNQGSFRANDGQVDLFLLGKGDQLGDCQHVNIDVADLVLACTSGIAGGHVHMGDVIVLGNLPGQGMLSPTIADDQHFHRGSLY